MSASEGRTAALSVLDARLVRVKRFVDDHYAEPLPLARVAAVAGLEKSYFSTYFRDKTGICYRDWLSCVRVDRALELMSEQDLQVTQVAYAVGFQDLRTFERACLRVTGHSPRVMRKRVRPSTTEILLALGSSEDGAAPSGHAGDPNS